MFCTASLLAAWLGCAKVNTDAPPGPFSGTGGSSSPSLPSIPGLKKLTVAPNSQSLDLTMNGSSINSASASFTATGEINGSTMDVTALVTWLIAPSNAMVTNGNVTVSGPGNYTITALSGDIKGSATLLANLKADVLGGGFSSGNTSKFDGSPSASTVSIAYPLDHAIFPSNFGVTVHVPKSGGQDIARLSWSGDGLDVRYFATCEPGPGDGCYVTLPASFASTYLVGASNQSDIRLTARLASSSGGNLVDSNTIQLAWAGVPLSGGLYYWTTIGVGSVAGYTPPDPLDPRGTAVMRYNFNGDSIAAPQLVWTDRGSPNTVPPFQESPPAVSGSDNLTNPPQPAWGEGRCVGCHAISFDGTLMAFSIGGSAASSYALLDIAAKSLFLLDPTAATNMYATGVEAQKKFRKGNFATFTTFGPKDFLVTMYRGNLTLRSVPDLVSVRDGLFNTATSERKTDPFWSPNGRFFAFTSYDPNQDTQNSRFNGDTKVGGQIWVAPADATGPTGDPKLIVPRAAGVTSYYPTISHDGTLLAFNKSSCAGPMNPGNYGTGACDGYDDITATLWLTTPDGARTQKLTRANAGEQNSNSWPRWSPDNGTFRNQRLYWLAFSSRRPYGLQINNGGSTGAKPQLWFAAVQVGNEFSSDPSAAAVWLPGQNLNQASPTGNHVPQWVKVAIPIP